MGADIFGRAEHLELVLAGIYRTLSEHLAGHALAPFLARMGDEEIEHARRIRSLANMYLHDRRMFPAGSPAVPKLDALLAEAEELQRRLAGPARTNAAEALLLMAELEDRFAAAHADIIAEGGDPKLRDFFTQLSRGDSAHAKALRLEQLRVS